MRVPHGGGIAQMQQFWMKSRIDQRNSTATPCQADWDDLVLGIDPANRHSQRHEYEKQQRGEHAGLIPTGGEK